MKRAVAETPWKEVTIKCPYEVETKVFVPPQALSGEKDFHIDIYCDSRLRSSLACPNFDTCSGRYFLIKVEDGKVKSYKGKPEY